jgi:hypothetical protein
MSQENVERARETYEQFARGDFGALASGLYSIKRARRALRATRLVRVSRKRDPN